MANARQEEAEKMPSTDAKTIERRRSEALRAGEQLGRTVGEVRHRMSKETLKEKGRERLREMAIEKPKEAADAVGSKAADLSRQTARFLRDQPFLAVALSAITLGLVTLLKGRR